MKSIKKKILYFLFLLCIYTFVVSSIQRFKNPELTDTELFLLINDNFFLKFN